jgi:N-acetylglutamate synthase-like GNAT family acetyltransferase
MTEYRIRLATIEDAAQLARLRWDFSSEDLHRGTSLAEFTTQFASFLAEALAGKQWAFWVIEDATGVLGTTFVQIIPKVPRPNRIHARWGYITNVYVVPEQRDAGLGAALLQHVQAWARAEELEHVILWPSARAVPFYLRAGFQQNGDILQWDIE